MIRDIRIQAISTAILLGLIIAIFGIGFATNASATFGRPPANSDENMAPMTGQIDKLEPGYITIDDVSYTLSNQVSTDGYKVGDRVTFVATYKNEIIKIYPASKKRQPKE